MSWALMLKQETDIDLQMLTCFTRSLRFPRMAAVILLRNEQQPLKAASVPVDF